MARTLLIPFSGTVQFDETGVVGDVVSFAVGSGPWFGSTAEITGDTLTAVHAVNPGFSVEYNLIAPLPLAAVDVAGLFSGGWLNDTNLEALFEGVPTAHQTYRAILQLNGPQGQWFGDKVIVNGQDLPYNGFNSYENGISYPNGEVDFIPDGAIYTNTADFESPVRVHAYAEVPAKDQYLFADFIPTAPGVWELVAESVDGPYLLSDDSLYSGPDPITIVVDCAPTYGQPPCDFRPFGDGEGTMDNPASEDNMTGAKGFKLNKGFKHKNGFTAKNGFTKENGF
jgi:hypothetical protein